jgi:hypothetical protein
MSDPPDDGELRLTDPRGGAIVSTSTSQRAGADPPASYRAIENLIASYAELVDDGDFAGVGILLADATFSGSAATVSGRDAIEKMLRESLIVYDDGTPRTRHITTNVAIEVDEEAGTAVSRSYFTALQALPDMALPTDRQRSLPRPLRAARRAVVLCGTACSNRPRRRREPPAAPRRRRSAVLAGYAALGQATRPTRVVLPLCAGGTSA